MNTARDQLGKFLRMYKYLNIPKQTYTFWPKGGDCEYEFAPIGDSEDRLYACNLTLRGILYPEGTQKDGIERQVTIPFIFRQKASDPYDFIPIKKADSDEDIANLDGSESYTRRQLNSFFAAWLMEEFSKEGPEISKDIDQKVLAEVFGLSCDAEIEEIREKALHSIIFKLYREERFLNSLGIYKGELAFFHNCFIASLAGEDYGDVLSYRWPTEITPVKNFVGKELHLTFPYMKSGKFKAKLKNLGIEDHVVSLLMKLPDGNIGSMEATGEAIQMAEDLLAMKSIEFVKARSYSAEHGERGKEKIAQYLYIPLRPELEAYLGLPEQRMTGAGSVDVHKVFIHSPLHNPAIITADYIDQVEDSAMICSKEQSQCGQFKLHINLPWHDSAPNIGKGNSSEMALYPGTFGDILVVDYKDFVFPD